MAVRRKKSFRHERDTLGAVRVPASAYYGAQTARAFHNFPISATRPRTVFIQATAMVKKAAAEANSALGLLDRRTARAVIRASDEIIRGRFHAEFIVDAFQAGAGTSHNMNSNEVIANRAIEVLGGSRGDYSIVHPNDHVNMSQSTNDVFPTAMRIAALVSSEKLLEGLFGLRDEMKRKSREFRHVVKSGRTHLQDAVPVTLGQEFGSYASTVESSIGRVRRASEGLKRIGLGGTAAGTGINTHPLYRGLVLKRLKAVTGIKGLKPAPDAFEALNSMTDFSSFSGALKDTALDLIKTANDLRLLSSGPSTGLSEIRLPAVQPGSSIMPGKVNPVMAEMLNMVCFQVAGNDLAVTLAAQAGQLELNVMGPVVNHNILGSLDILSNALTAFTNRCVKGIRADEERCARYFEASSALATALNPFIGYEAAALVAKEAASSGKTVREAVIKKGILTADEAEKLLGPSKVTAPRDLRKEIRSFKKRRRF